MGILFPEYATQNFDNWNQIESRFTELKNQLLDFPVKAGKNEAEAEQIATSFLDELPATKAKLQLYIKAMFLGDPAAKSSIEVVRTYPRFYAIFGLPNCSSINSS